MELILNIETTTRHCSVALFQGKELISSKSHISNQYSHSELLTTFVKDVMDLSGFGLKDLNAISVSKGPGSYTGLRIGIATSKGLCYALSIPLISVCPLRCMAFYIANKYPDYDLFCPMIDARRMEVFSSFYDIENKQTRAIQADILDQTSYKQELKNKVVFFGDGSDKCKDILISDNTFFIKDIFPSADYMGLFSLKKYKNHDFEDLAYFEPFYLKDFLIRKKD